MHKNSIVSTTVLVETPENIDLQAEPAGLVVRGLAFAIDFAIRAIFLIVLSFVLLFAGRAGGGVLLIVWFLIDWFYPVIFEVLWKGQTPGKKKMDLMVVNDDLTPIGWGSSVIRNLLRWADFFPTFYAAGLVCMAATRYHQRLGDLAAGTLVIYQERQDGNVDVPGDADRPQPPPVRLEREEQLAMISFTQRHGQLSPDRQRELADILAPLLPVEAPNRVRYLRGVGRWLLGDRGEGVEGAR